MMTETSTETSTETMTETSTETIALLICFRPSVVMYTTAIAEVCNARCSQ